MWLRVTENKKMLSIPIYGLIIDDLSHKTRNDFSRLFRDRNLCVKHQTDLNHMIRYNANNSKFYFNDTQVTNYKYVGCMCKLKVPTKKTIENYLF